MKDPRRIFSGRACARLGLLSGLAATTLLAFGGTATAALIGFRATVEQAQETPPNGSPSVWTGTFSLDTTTAMVTFTITQTGAPLVAPELFSHIHVAPIGVPGGIAFGLPVGNPKVGAYGPLTLAQMNDMKSGLHDVNIHSGAFPGGEVRGQVLPTAPNALPLDHYQCYKIKKDIALFPPTVSAVDQFGSSTLDLKKPFLWCNPVSKNAEPVFNASEHMLCYKAKGPNLAPFVHLSSVNQFGTQTLFAKKPFLLCVPGDSTIIP